MGQLLSGYPTAERQSYCPRTAESKFADNDQFDEGFRTMSISIERRLNENMNASSLNPDESNPADEEKRKASSVSQVVQQQQQMGDGEWLYNLDTLAAEHAQRSGTKKRQSHVHHSK